MWIFDAVIYNSRAYFVNSYYTLRNVMNWAILSDFPPSFLVLQLFCSSPKPALRYAAVRTLNKVGIPDHSKSCFLTKNKEAHND